MSTLWKNQAEALRRSSAIELAISFLYEEVAVRLPQQEVFWGHLAREEAEHAVQLRMLAELAGQGRLAVDIRHFDEVMIRRMDGLIEGTRRMMQEKPDIHHAKAAGLMLAVEGALAEQPVFTSIFCDDEAFRQITKELHDSTRGHIRLLLAASAGDAPVTGG